MLNFKELSLVDDIAKFLILDTYLGFDLKKAEVLNGKQFVKYDSEVMIESIKTFLKNVDYAKTKSTLINLVNKEKLPKVSDQFWTCLEENLHNYLKLIDPNNSVYKVEESFQYSSIERQAKIVAQSFIKQNTNINALSGFYALLTSEEEEKITREKNDFSIMYSLKRKAYVLLLGPIALVNHDCNANCSYTTTEEGSVYMSVKKNVQKGNEITCSYSKDYFGSQNLLYECKTCNDAKNLHKRQLKQIQIQDLSTSNAFVRKLIEFKTLTEKITPSDFDAKCQRKINNNFGKGLAYHNELYKRFIVFLKSNRMLTETCNEPNLESNEIKRIVLGVYKNWHVSSYKAVEKFLTNFFEIIKKDIQDYDENVKLLAPGFKAMENYILNLIITCIMLCPEEFRNCIYTGEPISHINKLKILTKMYRQFTAIDQDKLNNTLHKYNLYLQTRSRDLVNNVLKHVMLKDILEKKAIVLLESQTRHKDFPKSFANQSYRKSSSADTTRESSEPNSSYSYLTMEEINEMIGV